MTQNTNTLFAQTALLFQSAGGHALDDLPLERHENKDKWSSRQHTGGQRKTILSVIGCLVERDADRQRVVSHRIQKDKWTNKVIPRANESKHTKRRHRRSAQRQRDM